ncbi:YggT family protein [Metabacillus sp. GX 13764]|uniref:YggT family protein n=1 Tax=Metabacillus kandeliae TaxID=2900151 RepID=UPI001E642EDD|nr:YggT family protein [Metabacillus kandeliae]MCD7033874.1 YggT family protein [Metabacillus kandeliae]
MGLLYTVLNSLFDLYTMSIVIYLLMSWFPKGRESAIGQFLARIVEPFLEPFRRIIPPLGMIDISPIAALFVLRLARTGLDSIFRMLA